MSVLHDSLRAVTALCARLLLQRYAVCVLIVIRETTGDEHQLDPLPDHQSSDEENTNDDEGGNNADDRKGQLPHTALRAAEVEVMNSQLTQEEAQEQCYYP